MYLTQVYLLIAALTAVCANENEEPSGQHMPFDYFLNLENERLAETRPMEFNPDEGHSYRRQFEDQYGYRGERLIAMLGSGAGPLRIFDASKLQQKSNDNVAQFSTATASSVTTENPPEENQTENPHTNSTETEDDSNHIPNGPIERKYVEIDRRNNGFLTESFLENSIPKEDYRMSPDGIIYKRLFGSIWNHAAKGFPQNSAFDNTQGGIGFDRSFTGLGGFYPYVWGGLNLSPQFTQPINPINPIINEETNKPSQQDFAGPGEPSILVQSYSY